MLYPPYLLFGLDYKASFVIKFAPRASFGIWRKFVLEEIEIYLEKTREELDNLIDELDDFKDEKVLELSCKLDKIIYNYLIMKKCK